MHELSIAITLVELAVEAAQSLGAVRVSRLFVRLGLGGQWGEQGNSEKPAECKGAEPGKHRMSPNLERGDYPLIGTRGQRKSCRNLFSAARRETARSPHAAGRMCRERQAQFMRTRYAATRCTSLANQSLTLRGYCSPRVETFLRT